MEFGEAIKSFFNRYVDFQGRSSRSEFWWVQLFLFIVGFGAGFLAGFFIFISPVITQLFYVILLLFQLGVLIPSIALSVRRLHDTGRSGFFMLMPLAALPFYFAGLFNLNEALLGFGGLIYLGTAITLIVFFCLPGEDAKNKFGTNPLKAK